MFWLKVVPLNIKVMPVTDETFQALRGWLKGALWNMPSMRVTDETSQPEMFPLKELASANMLFMSVTDETSQALRDWLKEGASMNMLFMSVTDETSQPEMFPLKEEAASNMWPMLVTPERSGVSAAPYSMLDASWKAPSIDVHPMPPHWSIEASFPGVAPEADRSILDRPPVMATWYSPAAG